MTARQSDPLPIMRPGRSKVLPALPFQLIRPGLVAQIIANKVHVTGINEIGNATIGKVGNVMGKILHPIGMKLHVNAHVARFPLVRFLGDAQSCAGIFGIHKVSNARKVVTEGWDFALFANIVGVETRGLVGRGEAHVADQECRLTGKGIEGRIASVALMNQGSTLGNDGLHGVIFCLTNDLDAMRIVIGHVGVVLILHLWIGQSIPNRHTGQIQDDRIVTGQSLIVLKDTMRNRWCIMPTVGFTDNEQWILGIFRMFGHKFL
mmetsp:Transcript_24233/g.40143  ORF Transcript_24233/g.40143 Transcript_24233/m.40143 type:complete len:263 (-) Transcript_24233:820-1608(-)